MKKESLSRFSSVIIKDASDQGDGHEKTWHYRLLQGRQLLHAMADPFWKQDDNAKVLDQEAFYKKLDKRGHLKKISYMPDTLRPRVKGRKEPIINKRFEFVSFSWTEISDISFRNCIFEHCQFINSNIVNCEFQNCRFISTNTLKIAFSRTRINPRSFAKCLDKRKHQNIGVHLFQRLLDNSRAMHQSEYAREAHFLFLQWRRRQDAFLIAKYLTKIQSCRDLSRWLRTCGRYANRLFWEQFFGWCIKITLLARSAILFFLFAWCANFCFRESFGLLRKGEMISTWWESLYFTAVSLTTLGYGDIVPTTTAGQVWASGQTISGFFLLALLTSTLYRRVSS